MAQLPIFKDVWFVGPPTNGYPGAFPEGFIKMVRSRWWGKNRLWMFSGSYQDKDAVTVDLNPEVLPSIVADCQDLPLDDERFDFVMADPPYSEQEARDLYNMDYCSMVKVLNEAARVCKPGGHVLIFHRLFPTCHGGHNQHARRLQLAGAVGVITTSGYSNIRSLSVWRKREVL
jgi:SAM-dependent methyltransferase